MSVQGDTDAFDDGARNPKKGTAQSTMTTTHTSGPTQVENKAEPFRTDVQQPTQFSHQFQPNTGVEIQAASERRTQVKHVKNKFNIRAANISSTTFVYKPGAKKEEVNIKGGQFVQSTIGGNSEYHNENTSVSATKTDSQPGSMDIPDNPPYTPEQVVLKLLKTGVNSKDLIDLLEKEYSVVNLAYALPKSACKRNAMINALLSAVQEEEMEMESGQ